MSGETPRQRTIRTARTAGKSASRQVTTLATKEAARTKAEHDLREEQERLQRWNIELEQALNEKTAELRQSQGRLQALASELSLVEQRERKRLANELHDHLQQILVLGKLTIGRFANGVPDCEIVLKKVDDILSEALTYSRTLVTELSPPVLYDHGLAGGLQWLGDYMKKYGQTVTVMAPEDRDLKLPEDQVILLFQSARELLINSSKHAGTSEATVRMEQRNDYLQIEVQDEGVGFDVAVAADTPNGRISSKFGLFSIQERMWALGGSFHIHSITGQGTTATLVLPLSRRVENSRPHPSNFETDNARKGEAPMTPAVIR